MLVEIVNAVMMVMVVVLMVMMVVIISSHVVCENCDDCGVYQGIACPTVEPVLLLNKRRLKLRLFILRRLSCFARDN